MQISFNEVTLTLISRPCMQSSLAVRNSGREACSSLSRDVCHSLRHDHSTEVSDVVDELALCLTLKEAPRDHSEGT